jgi:RNA polymerase sigma-70 factor, ECF subfamily
MHVFLTNPAPAVGIVPTGGSPAGPWSLVFEGARQAWPDLQLSLDQFVGHLARLGIANPTECAHPSDLFLAFCCVEGQRAAIDHFDQRLLGPARAVVGRVRADDDFIDEVLQELRAKLLAGDGRALLGYAGRGPLLAWVRVAASRAAVDALRAAGSTPQTADVSDVIEEHDLGPEVRLLMEAHREAFQQSLAQALAGVSAQDRNLLRRHLVEGMTLEEIAAPYGVHPATIARRLAALRDDIAETVRSHLAERYGELSPTQLQSVFRAIRSQVYVSLSPLLAPDAGPPGRGSDGS